MDVFSSTLSRDGGERTLFSVAFARSRHLLNGRTLEAPASASTASSMGLIFAENVEQKRQPRA